MDAPVHNRFGSDELAHDDSCSVIGVEYLSHVVVEELVASHRCETARGKGTANLFGCLGLRLRQRNEERIRSNFLFEIRPHCFDRNCSVR